MTRTQPCTEAIKRGRMRKARQFIDAAERLVRAARDRLPG
jgi:hypothetical protein